MQINYNKKSGFILTFLFIFKFIVNNFKKGEEYMSVKVIISLVLSLSLLAVFFVIPTENNSASTFNDEFLRIHIRANSNADIDQNVKYEVKDAVVNYLTPLLTNAVDKKTAIKIVSDNLLNINNVADSVLSKNKFSYKTNSVIKKEEFPTRAYNNLTLPAGVYDSLIVNLGSGQGNNWWCVVYPPLCFVNADNSNGVTYRSKLLEIINSFWGKVNAS